MSEEREAIIDFANAIEAAAVNLKHRLGVDVKQQTKEPQVDKLKWESQQPSTSGKGPYEKCAEAAIPDFQELKTWIGDEPKYLRGYLYWVFTDGKVIGRRKKP